jgi:nucleotide-binding universal stress UspA family protein
MERPSVPCLDRIVVAVDLGSPSVAAATWTARHFGSRAQLVLVSVIEPPPSPPSLVQRYPSTDSIVDTARGDTEQKLRALCESLAPTASDLVIRVGRPHEQILQVADERAAHVIVLGRQDLGAGGLARVGAIAQRVLRHARIPVLVVAGEKAEAPQKILVAVDDSEMTATTLQWGQFLGERFASDVTALNVVDPQGSPRGIDAPPASDQSGKTVVEEARAWLQERVDRLAGEQPMTTRIGSGGPRTAPVIVAEARTMGADLIVIGSRGAGAGEKGLFGSVAESVVVSAPCPVFVVVSPR